MVDPNEAKGWFDTIIGAKKGDRTWVLSVVINFLLGAALVTTYYVFSAREKRAIEDKVKAETAYQICITTNLKDNKAYNAQLAKELKDCDEKWQVKFDNERNLNQKFLEDKAAKLEQEISYLRNESRKIRTQAQTINNRASR